GPVAPASGPADRVPAGWNQLRAVLDLLGGSVVHSLAADDAHGPLLSAIPLARQARFRPVDVPSEVPVRLSRFAALRSCEGGLVLESPLSRYRVVLHRRPAAWAAASLGSTTTVRAIADEVDAPRETVSYIACYLAGAGMLALGEYDVDGVPRFAEDSDPVLIPWSHNDLLFHTRSRLGRHDGPVGAVFPYLDELPPEPAVKVPPTGPRHPLHRPPMRELLTDDATLTEVIENLLPQRPFAAGGPTVEQLGELLYRAARVRSIRQASAGPGVAYQISDRPYPSSSDLYELEIYVVIDRCHGLPGGIYHYHPDEHFVTLMNTSAGAVDELFEMARSSTGTHQRPPVMISICARVARMSWMYSGTAYELILKHVGVLQHTLCLVAAAMGLAQAPLTMGDTELATSAFGLRWPAEVNVGEVVIGVPAS
ncbi:MAG TPA: SagB family peptide dehydrogenase, partial [Pseudonocardiaceae bacterium]